MCRKTPIKNNGEIEFWNFAQIWNISWNFSNRKALVQKAAPSFYSDGKKGIRVDLFLFSFSFWYVFSHIFALYTNKWSSFWLSFEYYSTIPLTPNTQAKKDCQWRVKSVDYLYSIHVFRIFPARSARFFVRWFCWSSSILASCPQCVPHRYTPAPAPDPLRLAHARTHAKLRWFSVPSYSLVRFALRCVVRVVLYI